MKAVLLLGLTALTITVSGSAHDDQDDDNEHMAEMTSAVENALDDLWRYEDIIHRDHQFLVGTVIYTEHNSEFYRYDALVGTVVPPSAFSRQVRKDCPNLIPVYQTFDSRNYHHFFTKDINRTLNYGDRMPFMYCAEEANYCGASEPLHLFRGQPFDYTGARGYDSLYTTNPKDADMPDKRQYMAFRPICYIWKRPESRNADDTYKQGMTNVELRHIRQHLRPIYSYFDKENHNHYLHENFLDSNQYVAQLGHVIKPESAELFKKFCPEIMPIYFYLRWDWKNFEFVNSEAAGQVRYRDSIFDHKTNRIVGYASPKYNYCAGRVHITQWRYVPNKFHENAYDNDFYYVTNAVGPADKRDTPFGDFDMFMW